MSEISDKLPQFRVAHGSNLVSWDIPQICRMWSAPGRRRFLGSEGVRKFASSCDIQKLQGRKTLSCRSPFMLNRGDEPRPRHRSKSPTMKIVKMAKCRYRFGDEYDYKIFWLKEDGVWYKEPGISHSTDLAEARANWRSGPVTVSEKQTSQNGAGIVRNSCVSRAPTWTW
jgi:hypothetical protein